MDLLQKKVDTARKAFRTFEEILEQPYSKVMRDAAIQRFEYTVEAVWKSLQRYNSLFEVVCFREDEFAEGDTTVLQHIRREGIKIL